MNDNTVEWEKRLRILLIKKFAYYTECQYATLEGLQGRKSSSKSEIRRQTTIAEGMLETLKEFDVTEQDLADVRISRVKEKLGFNR